MATKAKTEKDDEAANTLRDELRKRFDRLHENTTEMELDHCQMVDRDLSSFQWPTLSTLTSLNISNNEISILPGLSNSMFAHTLTHLDISRNWFNQIPSEISSLVSLVHLNVCRNFLRPNDFSLRVDDLFTLKNLRVLDLRWNKKLKRPDWRDELCARLPQVHDVHVTVSSVCNDGVWRSNAPEGSFVGLSPALRDANQLRAQLEPWGTLVLRRRLVETFQQEPTNSEDVLRAEVMESLLECYRKEGMMDDEGVGTRRIERMDGIKVDDEELMSELLLELRLWTSEKRESVRQERPSIKAENYMILRSPCEFGPKLHVTGKNGKATCGSRKAELARIKFERHQTLWTLAKRAMAMVDPEFSKIYTALAVTHGFTGSPHIDKQNITPFYGMSLGSFNEGEGGIRVEMNARVVVEVNTKGRLGKVDGRYPHWVAPWRCIGKVDGESVLDRYSLIYYTTEGVSMKKGPAVEFVAAVE